MTTIILVEDHLFMRQKLKGLLEGEADFQVVGETGDGSEALEMARKLRADVLVTDLMLPGLHGLYVVQQVHQECPDMRIVVVSIHADEPYVTQALRNGATAYVQKDSLGGHLIAAIRSVLNDRPYLSPSLPRTALEARQPDKASLNLDPYDTLTDRERSVLSLAGSGADDSEICGKLACSLSEALQIRARLMDKLGLSSLPELKRFAQTKGLASGS